MEDLEEITGRCLCGRVRFAYGGPENWRGNCYCETCRRATSSPLTSFLEVPNGAWRWTGEVPGSYASSPGVLRFFCTHCGSPMGFQSENWPDEFHFYAVSLDDPEHFVPDMNYHSGERLSWVPSWDLLTPEDGETAPEDGADTPT